MLTRQQNWQALQQQTFDVCVIGGGITGAGVAREAALRGLKVALVEAQDFASGTSSKSSKLVHGGLRYLEQLELGLVLEALLERNRLLQMAPHLVHYGRFILPLFKGDRVSPFKMGLGMWLYDVLSLFSTPLGHEYLLAEACTHLLPHLKRDNLQGAFAYSDAHMDDARLVIETLRSAQAAGAVCCNYIKAVGLKKTTSESKAFEKEPKPSSSLWQIELQDTHSNSSRGRLQAQQVMCAVGPWADEWAVSLWPGWQQCLKPSKGVHLCLKPEKLKLKQAVVMAANKQKRIVFAHPYQDVLLVGTTDTAFDEPMSSLSVTQNDKSFLLSLLQSYFPTAGLDESDIITSFAGVRPLVVEKLLTKKALEENQPHSTAQISRRPLLKQVQPGLWFLLGGKYTIYRKMAFEGVEAMVRQLPLAQQATLQRADSVQALNPMATQDQLFSAQLSASQWAQDSKRALPLVQTLVQRHGAEALSILHTYNSRIDFKLPWREALYLFEAYHAYHSTWCLRAVDFYQRRTGLGFQHKSTPPHVHLHVQKVFEKA